MGYAADYPAFLERLETPDIGVQLHPNLDHAKPSIADTCFQPTAWFGAIAVCSELLRADPAVKLASGPIPNRSFGDQPTHLQQALAGIINDSLSHGERKPGPHPAATLQLGSCDRADSCGLAETHFRDTVFAMNREHRDPWISNDGPRGWDIIVSATGEAVGLQKREGERSTLSVVPLSLNGITYPAGAIFRTNVHDLDQPEFWQNSLIATRQLTAAAFLRLSLFALPYQERLGYANQLGHEGHTVSTELPTLEFVRAATQKALDRMLATTPPD